LKKKLENRIVCTLKLARKLIPGLKNYKLGTIAAHLGITAPSAHRAMGDCEVTYGLWMHLMDLLAAKDLRALDKVEELMKF